jgi:hypothetical protein
MSTGTSNLRKHLLRHHPQEYDKAVTENNWDYQLSTQVNTASDHSGLNATTRSVPPFSAEVFLDHLVRFIVADDQVWFRNHGFLTLSHHFKSIRVVECHEFRQLCLVLRESLEDTDIPHRDKMREAIVRRWRESFKELKLDLSVSKIRLPIILTDVGQ